MNYFYAHLIEFESLIIRLDNLKLTRQQKKYLADLIDSTIHSEVLDMILSQLNKNDKDEFLKRLTLNPKDKKLLEFLNLKVGNIEEQIIKVVEKLKKELHQDMEDLR